MAHTSDKNITVLVIDDDSVYRKFMRAVIENDFNATVVEAKNPKEAFDYLKSNEPPDLITLDMQMPIMDGLTALKHIRLNTKTRNVSVIACTSLRSNDLLHQLAKLKIIDFIVKPAPASLVSQKIAKALKLNKENTE